MCVCSPPLDTVASATSRHGSPCFQEDILRPCALTRQPVLFSLHPLDCTQNCRVECPPGRPDMCQCACRGPHRRSEASLQDSDLLLLERRGQGLRELISLVLIRHDEGVEVPAAADLE